MNSSCDTLQDCNPVMWSMWNFVCTHHVCVCAWNFEGENCQIDVANPGGSLFHSFAALKVVFVVLWSATLVLLSRIAVGCRYEPSARLKLTILGLTWLANLLRLIRLIVLQEPWMLTPTQIGDGVLNMWVVTATVLGFLLLLYLNVSLVHRKKVHRYISVAIALFGSVSVCIVTAVTVMYYQSFESVAYLHMLTAFIVFDLALGSVIVFSMVGYGVVLWRSLRLFLSNDHIRRNFLHRMQQLIFICLVFGCVALVTSALQQLVTYSIVTQPIFHWVINSAYFCLWLSVAIFFKTEKKRLSAGTISGLLDNDNV